MTPIQCRAGRAIANLSQNTLSARVGISRKTLILFETANRYLHPNHVQALRSELERSGVEMIDGDRPGVRMAAEKAA